VLSGGVDALGLPAATHMKSLCFWKGIAGDYTVRVEGIENATRPGLAYLRPSPLARRIKNHASFRNRFGLAEGD